MILSQRPISKSVVEKATTLFHGYSYVISSLFNECLFGGIIPKSVNLQIYSVENEICTILDVSNVSS